MTEAGRDTDLANCEAAAYRQMPPDVVQEQLSASRYDGEKMTCRPTNGKDSCSTDQAAKATGAEYVSDDINEGARRSIVKSCMYNHGYVKK